MSRVSTSDNPYSVVMRPILHLQPSRCLFMTSKRILQHHNCNSLVWIPPIQKFLSIFDYADIVRIWLEGTYGEVRRSRQKVTKNVYNHYIVHRSASGTTYEDTVEHPSEILCAKSLYHERPGNRQNSQNCLRHRGGTFLVGYLKQNVWFRMVTVCTPVDRYLFRSVLLNDLMYLVTIVLTKYKAIH